MLTYRLPFQGTLQNLNNGGKGPVNPLPGPIPLPVGQPGPQGPAGPEGPIGEYVSEEVLGGSGVVMSVWCSM